MASITIQAAAGLCPRIFMFPSCLFPAPSVGRNRIDSPLPQLRRISTVRPSNRREDYDPAQPGSSKSLGFPSRYRTAPEVVFPALPIHVVQREHLTLWVRFNS